MTVLPHDALNCRGMLMRMLSRPSTARTLPSYLFVVAIFALICFARGNSMKITNHYFWDTHVYIKGLQAYKAGLDPYTDTVAYRDGQEKPLRFVYPPVFAKTAAVCSSMVPGNFGFLVYLCLFAVALASIPWLLARGYILSQWLTPLMAAVLFTFQPRFFTERVFLGGNVAALLYAAVLAAGIAGVQRNKWLVFFLAVSLATLVKPTFLIFLILPWLAGRGQLIRCILSAGTIVVLYAAERATWPMLYNAFQHSVYTQVVANHDYGLGLYGYFARLTQKLDPSHGQALASICHFLLLGLILAAFFLLRKRRESPQVAHLWVPALLVVIAVANPRMEVYDADIAILPAIFILMESLQQMSFAGTRAAASALLFTLFLVVFSKDVEAGLLLLLLTSLALTLWRLQAASPAAGNLKVALEGV